MPAFGAPPVTMVTLEEFEELPAAEVDLVSNHLRRGKALYTEYTVRTMDAIKHSADRPKPEVIRNAEVGWDCTAVERWSALSSRTKSGLWGSHMVRKQYLLFLGYRSDTDAYFPIKIWHIQQDRTLKAAFPDDQARVAGKSRRLDGRLVDISGRYLEGQCRPIEEMGTLFHDTCRLRLSRCFFFKPRSTVLI